MLRLGCAGAPPTAPFQEGVLQHMNASGSADDDMDAVSDPFVPQIYDPESIDGLKLSLSWWLVGTARLWRNILDERLKSANQTQPRWRVLAWAQMMPGIKQTDLADRMGIASPTLVRILDSLEEQGMIQRREGARDRRVKEIHITEKAGPLVRDIANEVKLIRDTLLRDIPEDDLRVCLDVLSRIRERVPQLSEREVRGMRALPAAPQEEGPAG